jgi:hypothetical protein
MYFPPYKQLVPESSFRKEADGSEVVVIPKKLLELLFQTSLATATFNESGYVAQNPDVANGPIRKGELTAKQHFCAYGYFVGQEGGLPRSMRSGTERLTQTSIWLSRMASFSQPKNISKMPAHGRVERRPLASIKYR